MKNTKITFVATFWNDKANEVETEIIESASKQGARQQANRLSQKTGNMVLAVEEPLC